MVVEFTTEEVSNVEVGSIIRTHLDFCFGSTPAEGVFALSATRLADPAVTVFGVRTDGELRGICALATLDATHAELKSMHVLAQSRGEGLARQLVAHVLSTATQRGITRVSLETGSSEAFGPARALYERLGFTYTTPFGSYQDVPTSVFMTLSLPTHTARG